MKKILTTTFVIYILYWILILLFTEIKNITLIHFEISITIVILPIYLGGITKICDGVKKYLRIN